MESKETSQCPGLVTSLNTPKGGILKRRLSVQPWMHIRRILQSYHIEEGHAIVAGEKELSTVMLVIRGLANINRRTSKSGSMCETPRCRQYDFDRSAGSMRAQCDSAIPENTRLYDFSHGFNGYETTRVMAILELFLEFGIVVAPRYDNWLSRSAQVAFGIPSQPRLCARQLRSQHG